MQVLLQLENFILLNTISNKVRVDDDFVWEIANSIRWLSQTFKDKFKIEKFLFGEIYSNYFVIAPELIVGLMEELGYDKDDNLDENNTSLNSSASPSTSILITPHKSPSALSKNSNNYSQFSETSLKESQSGSNIKPAPAVITAHCNLTNLLKEDSNSNSSNLFVSRVNSLFEDFAQPTEPDSHENDDFVSSQNNEDKDRDSDDLLNDFKKEKNVFLFYKENFKKLKIFLIFFKRMNRFTAFAATTTSAVRSIVVQSKKRVKNIY